MKKYVLWTCSIIVAASLPNYPVFSRDGDQLSPGVDRLFEKWNTSSTPGCALAIIRGNETVYQRCLGLATRGYGIPITPSASSQIVSVSNQFTAFAVTMLELEHRLSLDDDICKYVQELPDFGKPVTICYLNHHSRPVASNVSIHVEYQEV